MRRYLNRAQTIILKCAGNSRDSAAAAVAARTPLQQPRRKLPLRSYLRWFLIALALLWSLAVLILIAARWIDPPTTAVHMERRLQSWIHRTPYHERYDFVPLSQISPDFQHAVIAAEDAASTSITASIGTPWKSPRKTICKAGACAAAPPLPNNS